MSLEAAYRGFREAYLDHEAITAQLRAWVEAFPALARLTSLGNTPEGRDLWLLTVGTEPDRARPSAWVDGNMHASELCGSSVALQIAEDVLMAHLNPTTENAPLRETLVHVLPRMSPDGAEAVLKTGQYVRSAPRTVGGRGRPWWRAVDVDGDGQALLMRVLDDGGEFVESKVVPGFMVLRDFGDEGPFYKVWPEGVIEDFDGHHIPDPTYLSDNDVDFNRQFPYLWKPEHVQQGGGPSPLAGPETRAVVDFASAHPEIFTWLNLHTFGGVFIRPLGDEPDRKLDPGDLALYRAIGEWAHEMVGYPMVSGYEEFLYSPDVPVYGDLVDYAFRIAGAVGLTCELWDLFAQVGIAAKKPFIDTYLHLSRADFERIAVWDRDHNASRVVRPWKRVVHPQLGDVEVGGLDPRVGISNPPYDLLGDVCRKVSKLFLRMASLTPQLRVRVERAPGVARVVVENHGYLPTHVLAAAKVLAHGGAPWVDVRGATGDRRVAIEHLDGWGRGRFDGTGAIYFLRSRGNGHRRVVEFACGEGPIEVRVGCPRTGVVTCRA